MIVVGAGLSGVGAVAHLQDRCPDLTWTVLEARDAIGGTWDLFRYPGVRSDSDMFTLGYAFRPWTSTTAIADGATIRTYIADTARERGIDRAVRFGHRVVAAEWSQRHGALDRDGAATRRAAGTVTLTCRFLFFCAGYYRYERGYEPVLPGAERFAGEIVHPQHWPADLQWAGRRVVVVGSGATAVTLVPALARDAAHVTMLQRSPSYVLSVPTRDPLARRLFGGRLPLRPAAALVRARNIALVTLMYRLSRRFPARMRRYLLDAARAQLPPGYDVDTHFSPAYDPWDQRLCVVPERRPVPGRARGPRVGGHRPDRHPDRARRGPRLGHRAARGRRRRPRRALAADAGRRDAAGRRPGRRPRPERGLPGRAAVGCAELRADLRLHQRLVDAQGGPGCDVRVPAAAAHAQARPRPPSPRSTRRRTGSPR